MHHPVFITAAVDDPEVLSQMNLAVENQLMFSLEERETPNCIKLDIVEVEGYCKNPVISLFQFIAIHDRSYKKNDNPVLSAQIFRNEIP